MKCFLHIGTEKTGTSTIQEFLYKNRESIKTQNFYLLDSIGKPNNNIIALSALNSNKRDDLTNKYKLLSDDSIREFQRISLQSIKKEINNFPKNSKVIISSEHIQSRLNTIEEIERLKSNLTEIGFKEIIVILYVRKPSETANSLFSTAIKSSNLYPEVPPPSNKYFEHICNHKKTIESFSSVFGKDSLQVRLFRKDKFLQGSLIFDFSEIIGLNLNIQKFDFPINQNESLSLLGILLLKNLNEKFPSFIENQRNPLRGELVQYISKHFQEPKFQMQKELYEAYDSYFSESNEWVRQNYFPEEAELFLETNYVASSQNFNPKEIESISNLISDLWIRETSIPINKWDYFKQKSFKEKLKMAINYFLKK